MSTPPTDERFLDEAVSRGDLTPEQAQACRRLRAALDEVRVDLSVDDVAVRKGYLTRAAADEIQRALARRRVGRYEVLERLGRGGSATVFRARDTRLERTVALKVVTRSDDVPPDRAERLLERFRREARVAVTLNHENVVRGLDYGEADGYVFYAMEFVAGENLATRLERTGSLPADEALRVTRDVVRALAHVHEFGLVHRDVKPGNVLVTPDGVVKLCDLGLARPEALALGGTRDAGLLAGTPLYVAPEQIRDPRGVDWRADVYGLGATLYHLLTGRPPFPPQPGTSVLHRHLEEAPADPREHVVDLSPSVAAVVLKMLAKDPADRYMSLVDLAADIEAVLAARPPIHALHLEASAPGAIEDIFGDREARAARATVPEAPVGWRLGVVPTVAASAAVLACALVVVFLVGRDRPAPVDTPAPPPDSPAQAPSPPPREPPATPPDRDPGRPALELARNLAASPDADVLEVIEQYEHVVDSFAEHASGRSAAAEVERLRAELESRADEELARRTALAEALEAEGRYGAAIEALGGFPPELRSTEAAGRSLVTRERLRSAGRDLAAELETAAEEAVAADRFDVADEHVSAIRAIGLPGVEAVADRAQQRIILARTRLDALRTEQAPTFSTALAEAVLLVRDEGWDAARRRLAVEHDADALSAYRSELMALDADLRRAEAVGALVLQHWADLTASGASIELRLRDREPSRVTARAAGVLRGELLLGSGGESIGVVRLSELTLVSLGRIIGRPFDDADGDERRARLVFLLAERNLPAAEEYLALLDLAGREDPMAHRVADAVLDELRARLDTQLSDLTAGLTNGTAERTLRAVEELLAAWPGHGPAFSLRGLALERQGARDAAEQAYVQAAAAETPDPRALLHLGRLLLRRGRLDEAEARLLDLLSHEPDGALHDDAVSVLVEIESARRDARIETLWRDARQALRRKDTAAARPLLEDLVALVPDHADALLALGELYLAERRHFDAFVALRTLELAHAGDERASRATRILADHVTRFRVISREDRAARRAAEERLAALELDAALAGFDDVLRAAPFFREARLGRAQVLLLRFESDGIAADLAGAAEEVHLAELLGPGRHETRLLRIDVRLAQGRAEEALAEALEAAEDRPASAAPLLLAGRAHLAADRPDDALAAFEAAYERVQHAEPLYWQARAFARQGRLAAARATLAAMIAEHPLPPTLAPRVRRLRAQIDERND